MTRIIFSKQKNNSHREAFLEGGGIAPLYKLSRYVPNLKFEMKFPEQSTYNMKVLPVLQSRFKQSTI